ncbi:MAG: hypothetical protein V3T05_13200 [Myxococcota bacterium]
MPQNSQGTAEVHRRRRPLRYAFRQQKTSGLSKEPRRALAVYRALNLTGDKTSSHALLSFSGRPAKLHRGSLVIGPVDCAALARRLREDGYPLTDDGIVCFKIERGFSNVVRIGPDVAAAYGRFARGKDTRLNVSADEWKEFDDETRRALTILMLIGRDPESLIAVRRVLGVRDSHRAPDGVVLVGSVTARRLVRWAQAHGWSLDDPGLVSLARAVGLPTADIGAELATFVADSVLCRGEPIHDYTQYKCGRHILSRRTLTMLRHAERRLRSALRFEVIKGSYLGDNGDSRGAHPHMGGGVVDLTIGNVPSELMERAVLMLRESGFAAWYRDRIDRPHIHTIAIGDVEAAPAALWQVKSYFGSCDGRSRSDRDPHRKIRARLPRWVAKYRVAFI